MLRQSIKKSNILILSVLLLALNGYGASQKALKFQMQLCGVGVFRSTQIYSVSDGTTITVENITYESDNLAKKALRKELSKPVQILKQEQFSVENEILSKQRYYLKKKVRKNVTIVLVEVGERDFYKITAASINHLSKFREYLRHS